MTHEESVRKTLCLKSSRYIVSKIDSWSPEEKKWYLTAYTNSDWNTVYAMTEDLSGCAYSRQNILGELADVVREQLEICPECGQHRPGDERVKAGMKCGLCAYGYPAASYPPLWAGYEPSAKDIELAGFSEDPEQDDFATKVVQGG
jgi:hypothetical protein